MSRLLPVFLAGIAVFVIPGSSAQLAPRPLSDLPVGTWKIEFSNRVIETCDIASNGESFVDEPLRRAIGIAKMKDGAVDITFADDRVERWTAVGNRFVVEHWAEGSRTPRATPVFGIADRVTR